MTSQSQGIQQLLQAEKRAKDKLEEAKKNSKSDAEGTTMSLKCCLWNFLEDRKEAGKGRRLKQAKEEAVAETDQYRLQMEREFRLKQSKVMGSQSHLSDEIEDQTLEKIKELNRSYSACVESVMSQLLSMVCSLKAEVHVNYRATD